MNLNSLSVRRFDVACRSSWVPFRAIADWKSLLGDDLCVQFTVRTFLQLGDSKYADPKQQNRAKLMDICWNCAPGTSRLENVLENSRKCFIISYFL